MSIPINLITNEFPGVQIIRAPTPAECPKPETERIGAGQGMHLGLRSPWYNDMSHDITDSTAFRILLIVITLDWFAKKLGWWN